MIEAYEDDRCNTALELRESSIEYPDSKFYFNGSHKSLFTDDECRILQWLAEYAGDHVKELAEFTHKNYCDWE